jgi:hypothetical protein
MLKILFFDGEFLRGEASLPLLGEIEGRVTSDGIEPIGPLEEAEKVLEMCCERYTVARPSRDFMTVAIARKTEADVEPLVRLDILARDGIAHVSIQSSSWPRWDAEPAYYTPEDDAVAIVRKVLASL